MYTNNSILFEVNVCILKSNNIFESQYLFVAALWFHNVRSLDFSVAVNVFFRHLEANYYDSKDPYGNKDPQAAARALQILNRALKCLEELPDEYRDFYGRRMISENWM